MATNTSSNMVVDLTAGSAIVPVRKGISFRNSIPFVTSLLQGSAVGDIHFYDERIPVICERTWTEGNVLQVFYDVNLDPNEHMHQIIVRVLIGLYMHGENSWYQDWTVEDIFELEWATDSVAADVERDAKIELFLANMTRTCEIISNKFKDRTANKKLHNSLPVSSQANRREGDYGDSVLDTRFKNCRISQSHTVVNVDSDSRKRVRGVDDTASASNLH